MPGMRTPLSALTRPQRVLSIGTLALALAACQPTVAVPPTPGLDTEAPPTTEAPTTTQAPTTTTTVAPPTTTQPPVSPALLWSAGHENGSLSEWESNWGGGIFSSGSYEAVVSGEAAKSGSRSLRARIWTPSESGVRAFRWKEPRENRELYYSAWVYMPEDYRVTGNYVHLFQFKSRSTDGRNDPIWGLYGVDDGKGGIRLQAGWGWGGTPVSGPYASDGVGGKWIQSSVDATLPTGRWVHVEAFLRQSKDFDGRLKFWVDGKELFDLNQVRTSFDNCTYNSWCASNEWSVNLYSDGLSASPATMYIDDAAIARSYIP